MLALDHLLVDRRCLDVMCATLLAMRHVLGVRGGALWGSIQLALLLILILARGRGRGRVVAAEDLFLHRMVVIAFTFRRGRLLHLLVGGRGVQVLDEGQVLQLLQT